MVSNIPFLISTIWALQYAYLRTSRQLRLLELEVRVPCTRAFWKPSTVAPPFGRLIWESRFRLQNNDLTILRDFIISCTVAEAVKPRFGLIVGAQVVLVVRLAVGLRCSTSAGPGVSLNNTLSTSITLIGKCGGYVVVSLTKCCDLQRRPFIAYICLDDAGNFTQFGFEVDDFRGQSES
ncbi:uncharacterized protein ATNIH1004_002214 [Aspergillus tanneri]|uniref:Uncharacterized protein n=1 Tax=Aspergillus tanneri TaxID=1220188 RepID=A0A5M9MXA5_9EURO|nr:uncharacterized protein ATNIH1004_002214 [Aspergillus tanneri]KAA8649543.1 hypothetical protein ATNIH1004_002214 [Aspergillus tanneri]